MSDVLFDEVSRCRQEITRLTREIDRLTLEGIHTCHAECQRPVCRLTRERGALLEALRTLFFYANTLEMRFTDADGEHRAMQQARATIKRAEGEGA